MQIRLLAVLALTLAVAACEAESTGTAASTTDTTAGADTAGKSDAATTDTAAADTAVADAGTTDTAAADVAATDSSPSDAVVAGAFAPAGAALANKCATCHSSMPNPKFDGKDCAVAAALATKIQAEISKGSMPLKGSPALTPAEAAAIAAWVAAGAKCK